jgi:hypothetical protein
MRSLWLASAAFIVISGTAFAQTTPAPGMANPGSQSTQGTMSQPGTMGNPNQGAMSEPYAGYNTAARYLQRARIAIQQHRRFQADNLLANAETIMLTRAVPQSSASVPDSSPRIVAIDNARAALRQGNWTSATQYTDEAIQRHAAMNPNGSGSMAQPNHTVQ